MSEKKKKLKAIKIVATEANMPLPTTEMMEELAKGIYIGVSTNAAMTMSTHAATDWEELDDNVRDMWRAGSRAAFAVIAVHGGASPQEINAKQDK